MTEPLDYCSIEHDPQMRAWPRRLASAHRRAQRVGVRQDPFDWYQLKDSWYRDGMDPLFCVYCCRASRGLDHLVPLRRGGPHALVNLVPACLKCNRQKGSLLLTQWLQITNRLAYPIPAPVLVLTIRTATIRSQLEQEGRIVQYGNPPRQAIGPDPYWKGMNNAR